MEVAKTLKAVSKECPNFHWLNLTSIEINGIRFSGTTLWFADAPANILYRGQLNDFSMIRSFEPWVYGENAKAKRFFRMCSRPDVVVTHHIPTDYGITEQYRGDPLNRFFVTDLSGSIPFVAARYWIYGHTHIANRFDYCSTRFICNPLGYPHDGVNGFGGKLIIEV